MTASTANWSFTQDDFTAITESLLRFLGETKSLCALLVDRGGEFGAIAGADDLPGGGRRFVVRSKGIEYTIVNGQVLYEHGAHTGALPGHVLRS